MSAASAIKSMQDAVIEYIKKNIPKDENMVQLGKVEGNHVIIGNKSYPYTIKVDQYIENGANVFCILPDARNIAVIVGVE